VSHSKPHERYRIDRRTFLAVGMGGAAAARLGATRVLAADWTAAERANVKVVNDFCAAWETRDPTKITAFFTEDCTYRPLETAAAAKGRDAVTTLIKTFVASVQRFEILETFAKGPMVFNERIDHFTSGPLRSWHGVGVFFLKDGKIAEWDDYTISMVRT
jgi:limonene-1,2-epoxide hydrolase